ncbi:hypothetical protein K402DRAFT_423168 [Aulographum hederae CBS 113979]|uniref:Uncharacterized protein n=1 Tax=Aulographum hederae CBS 113979 TaxID=1176131 RepID=A0A6G1GTK9_9PEZI|nr:hypothetical protein K402DRAFT_423168 [Aulographum hederae CBS 113979]
MESTKSDWPMFENGRLYIGTNSQGDSIWANANSWKNGTALKLILFKGSESSARQTDKGKIAEWVPELEAMSSPGTTNVKKNTELRLARVKALVLECRDNGVEAAKEKALAFDANKASELAPGAKLGSLLEAFESPNTLLDTAALKVVKTVMTGALGHSPNVETLKKFKQFSLKFKQPVSKTLPWLAYMERMSSISASKKNEERKEKRNSGHLNISQVSPSEKTNRDGEKNKNTLGSELLHDDEENEEEKGKKIELHGKDKESKKRKNSEDAAKSNLPTKDKDSKKRKTDENFSDESELSSKKKNGKKSGESKDAAEPQAPNHNNNADNNAKSKPSEESPSEHGGKKRKRSEKENSSSTINDLKKSRPENPTTQVATFKKQRTGTQELPSNVTITYPAEGSTSAAKDSRQVRSSQTVEEAGEGANHSRANLKESGSPSGISRSKTTLACGRRLAFGRPVLNIRK